MGGIGEGAPASTKGGGGPSAPADRGSGSWRAARAGRGRGGGTGPLLSQSLSVKVFSGFSIEDVQAKDALKDRLHLLLPSPPVSLSLSLARSLACSRSRALFFSLTLSLSRSLRSSFLPPPLLLSFLPPPTGRCAYRPCRVRLSKKLLSPLCISLYLSPPLLPRREEQERKRISLKEMR